jgi:Fic family protein
MALGARTVLGLSEADTALGRLAGAGRLLPNPHLFVNPYIVREAVASSRIEGTQSSISDVFDAEASGELRGDVREVLNYVRALQLGLRLLPELPLSLRLIRAVHVELMDGVRGGASTPEAFRTTQNWIGSPGDSIHDAVFVPPPPDEMKSALDDWERFAHETPLMPTLVQCALLHYQFETIHPFLDGNGRLGRLLIVFFLVEQGRLSAPLLYVSSFFERNRAEYYDRLQAVRAEGRYQEWVEFFLRGVETQARDSVSRAERLLDLRERYRATLAPKSRRRAVEAVEILFELPIVTARVIAERLGISVPGAKNLLELLEQEDIVRSTIVSSSRAKRWVAEEVLGVIAD